MCQVSVSEKNTHRVLTLSLAVSYNRPNLSLCASWNENATTLADINWIGRQPAGIFVNDQNAIYVANRENGHILVWQNGSSIPSQNISGNWSNPWSLFITTDGSIYIDNGYSNNRVDKWALDATYSVPVMNVNNLCTGLFVDMNDNLYCSSMNSHRVLKTSLNDNKMLSITIAGTGCPGPVPNMLDHPHAIFVDNNSNLFVADTDNNRIQLFVPDQSSGITVAGFGAIVYFILNKPTSIVLDAGGYMFIVDSYNHRIVRSIPNGFKCLVGCSGNNGAKSNELNTPQTMAFDPNGNILVTDFNNHRIQKFMLDINSCEPPTSTIITTTRPTTTVQTTTQSSLSFINENSTWKQHGIIIAGGNEKGNQSNQLDQPYGIYVDDDNQSIYIADFGNLRIVKWECDAKNGVVAGGNGRGNRMDQLNYPTDVIFDKKNNSLIICDWGNKRVIRWSLQNNQNQQIIISDINCSRLAMDIIGDLYVSDYVKHEVIRWKIGNKYGTIVAGGNGQGNNFSQFNYPTSMFVDQDYSVYVSDRDNNRVMKWMKGAKEGVVVAGGKRLGNSLRQLFYPAGVIVDDLGNVYVADSWNHRIMRWLKGSKKGTIIVGGNGKGEQSYQLNSPSELSFDQEGNLYVVDYRNCRVEKFVLN